jgi:tryptophan-rich sensory protein
VSKAKNIGGLVVCFLVAFAAGALGSIASVRAAQFYQELSRPTWAPPAGIFGPVWTALYCSMAVASWLVWWQSNARTFAALAVYALQLALNALWSWLFFAWRQGSGAFIEVLVLWVCILATILLFWRVRRAAAILLVPYLLWVSYASCLTFAVWRLNPRLLS